MECLTPILHSHAEEHAGENNGDGDEQLEAVIRDLNGKSPRLWRLVPPGQRRAGQQQQRLLSSPAQHCPTSQRKWAHRRSVVVVDLHVVELVVLALPVFEVLRSGRVLLDGRLCESSLLLHSLPSTEPANSVSPRNLDKMSRLCGVFSASRSMTVTIATDCVSLSIATETNTAPGIAIIP